MGAVANGDGGRASDGAGGSSRRDVPLRVPRVVVAAATYTAFVRRVPEYTCTDSREYGMEMAAAAMMAQHEAATWLAPALSRQMICDHIDTGVLSTAAFTALALEPLRVCEFDRN